MKGKTRRIRSGRDFYWLFFGLPSAPVPPPPPPGRQAAEARPQKEKRGRLGEEIGTQLVHFLDLRGAECSYVCLIEADPERHRIGLHLARSKDGEIELERARSADRVGEQHPLGRVVRRTTLSQRSH